MSWDWPLSSPSVSIPRSACRSERNWGAAIPQRFDGYVGRDLGMSDGELRVAGVTNYLMRTYESNEASGFSLYVGYYDWQMSGKTIHSPKNCLPGAGWEVLESKQVTITTAMGSMLVNRYLLQKDDQRALVLYWYQGRGRVRASEYVVKWDLLRDAALRKRSEEALVRVIVPITSSEEQSFGLAERVAAEVSPALNEALPLWTAS